jgi:dTDP-4-amino-4,6-dideoxygalactose transaminase
MLDQREPWIDQREIDEVNAALSAGLVSVGPRTREFELRFASFVGTRHAIAVNSCWAGFHLAFEALGLAAGDEVLTSIASSTAAVAAITHVGARPVMVDVDLETLTLDTAEAARKVTPRTKVIMPSHFGGCPAAMDPILDLAARHRLLVVEDAIDALPAWSQGRIVGSIGLMAVFGLSQDLSITTGEGSVVTTERDDLADVIRARRFFGVPPDSAPPFQARTHVAYEAARTYGFGYQMADVSAAVGLGQLAKIEMFHAIRSYYAGLYELGLSDLDELILPRVPRGVQHAWGRYVIRLRRERVARQRDAVIRHLQAQNVDATVGIVPQYAHGYYGGALGLDPREFPNARTAHDTSISLPLYPRMVEADVWDVIHAVRQAAQTESRR